MIVFKNKRQEPSGILTSEICLKETPVARRGKIEKLIKLLRHDKFELPWRRK